MHPLALACARHHGWLVPIPMQALRAIRNGAVLSDFVAARISADYTPLTAAEAALVESALWVEQSLTAGIPIPSASPLAATDSTVAALVINTLLALLTDECAAGYVATCLGESPLRHNFAAERMPYRILTVRAHDGKDCHVNVPDRLQPRQALLGVIGTLLRQPASDREVHSSLTKPMLAWLLGRIGGWPLSVIDWLSDEAGQFVREAAELRARYDVSPRYFRAYAALLSTFK